MAKRLVAVTGVLVLALVLVVMSCAPTAPPTATPADFYKGKSIDLVVSASPGGLNDLTARIMASHLGGDTRASVVVTNRKGAGGLDGMNYLYKAKPDGLTLGVTPSTKFVSNWVMQDPAAVYDIEKFSYIITVGHRLGYFLVSPEGPYQSVADLQGGKDLKIGGSTASGYISLGSLTVIKLLGLDAKVITGIDSESDRALAVKRGEIIGYFESIATARAGLIAGLVKPMFVVATERDPLMPDVPAITELVNLTDEDLALVKLWETTFASSTLLAASPGTPEDRLAFLRGLVNKWVQDEGFREEISAVSGYDLREEEYITGEEVTQEMLDTAGALDEFQTIFAELIEKYRA